MFHLKRFGLPVLIFIFLIFCHPDNLLAQCGSCTGGPQNVSWEGWTFSFLRPCLTGPTTAGGRGGGLEIDNAKYHGKLVFTKAHTPILNVKYMNDACGPYRDWQDEESVFQCTNVTAPGRCDGPAITNCENPGGGDIGSFCGVSVSRTPTRLTLTTNVQAGWYRYILKWHFYPNGTFHPEAYFGTIPASCVNNQHVHMIYFRVDMDIEGSTPNTAEEHYDSNYATRPTNGPEASEFPESPEGVPYWDSWDPIFLESARFKQADGSRWWRIRNSSTGRAYLIYPPETFKAPTGPDEVTVFPQIADIWFLKYNSANQEETDDFGDFQRYWAHLGQFLNDSSWPNDSLIGADIVVWYGGGTLHAFEAGAPACHVVAGPYYLPDPKAVSW
jgi:hypothetical protein